MREADLVVCWAPAAAAKKQKANGCYPCSFSWNKGGIVHIWEKPAVSTFKILPRVLSLIFVLLHRSFYCSREMRPLLWLTGGLSMICREDCHCVGRLGLSASPHTAAGDCSQASANHDRHPLNVVSPLEWNVAFSQITKAVIQHALCLHCPWACHCIPISCMAACSFWGLESQNRIFHKDQKSIPALCANCCFKNPKCTCMHFGFRLLHSQPRLQRRASKGESR